MTCLITRSTLLAHMGLIGLFDASVPGTGT